MIGPWLKLWRDAEIGAKETTAELSDELFTCAFRPVLCVARQVTADQMLSRCPVRFMPISA